MRESLDVASLARIFELCLQGDQLAWQQLVQRYARLVHSVPVRYGLTPVEVDDVGQEVFLALTQNLHQIHNPERISAWLITTARHSSWRVLQRRKHEQPSIENDLSDMEWSASAQNVVSRPLPTINELLVGWQREEMLEQGLRLLNPRCRDLFNLLFLSQEEPSYDEISARLAIPKGSISPTRNRCLQQLRSILQGLGFDDPQ